MPNNLEALRLHARLALRDLIWLVANRHRQGDKPNVGVFGSRRSGSTLLMQSLAANSGVKSIDQPCSVFSASAYQVRQLPIRDCGQLHHLDDQEEEIFGTFIERITAGELHVNEPWQFWQRGFAWRSDRLIFKVTNGHGLAEWLGERFGWQTVVLLRHPLSQSLSVSNLKGTPGGWHSRAPGLFRSEAYCREHLDARQVALVHDTWNGGNELDRHVLGWTLENLPLLRAMPRHPEWSFVSYEAMVLEPEAVVNGLSQSLDLPDTGRMRDALGSASRSVRNLSVADRQAAIRKRDTTALLGSWRRRIEADDERRTFAFLETFGIDLYRCGSDVPTRLWSAPAALPS